MNSHVFIYGTLKRQQVRADLLRQQQFLREVVTSPLYQLVDCGDYPGLIQVAPTDGQSIHGELWSISNDCLKQLDDYEAVAHGLYARGIVELIDGTPDVVSYFYLRDTTGLPRLTRW